MAIVTWIGGTHRIGDPNVWTPAAPGPGDIGYVPSGNVVAVGTTVGPYTIALAGTGTTATFDAIGTTLTGTVGVGLYNSGPSSFFGLAGQVDLVGANTNNGSIVAASNYLSASFPSLKTVIADVASPNGTVIQQGVLTNGPAGAIRFGEGTSSSVVTSPSVDGLLLNNGVITADSALTVDVAVGGTGTISGANAGRDNARITFTKAVGTGQTVSLSGSSITLDDPLEFGAKISLASAYTTANIVIPFAVDSADYANGILYLAEGTTLVAALRLGSLAASGIAVSRSGSGTSVFLTTFNTPGNIPVGTGVPGFTAPAILLPAAAATLPGTGPDLTFASGAQVASSQTLDGYTIHLEGVSAGVAPSVDAAAAVFGPGFVLDVAGAGATARFGGLFAVGGNVNAGLIEATSGTGGGAGVLAIDVTDVVAPDGVGLIAGLLGNTGTIEAAAGSTVTVTGDGDAALANTGRIVVDGAVTLGVAVTGTGLIGVGTDPGTSGSLEVGAVSAGQTIALGSGVLTIDSLAGFAASVSAVQDGDVIVLKNTNVQSLSYGAGVLALDGGATGSLKVQAAAGLVLGTGSFTLSHAGADTVVTVTGAAAAGLGSGPDTITLDLSEDAYAGDAQFTLAVDGQQVGGVQTVTAAHAAGAEQAFVIAGTFGTGSHEVTVTFLNDLYAGTPATDRNLYVDGIAANRIDLAANRAVYYDGRVSFRTPTLPGLQVVGSGPDRIDLAVSEDAYRGDAQFTVTVDHHQVGGVQTVTALHGGGAEEDFAVLGSFGAGPHEVTVDFLNDAYAGTPATDRNLYVDSIQAGGVTEATDKTILYAGNVSFTTPPLPPASSSANAAITPASVADAAVEVGTGMTFATGPATATQAVDLAGGTLEVTDSASFKGVITAASGFTDTIQLDGVSAASLAFDQATPSGGVLTLFGTGGQAVASLQFGGAFDSGAFHLDSTATQPAHLTLIR